MAKYFEGKRDVGDFKREFQKHIESKISVNGFPEKTAEVLRLLVADIQKASFTAVPKQNTILGKLEKIKKYNQLDEACRAEAFRSAIEVFDKSKWVFNDVQNEVSSESAQYDVPPAIDIDTENTPSALQWRGQEKNALKKSAHELARGDEVSVNQALALTEWGNKLRSIRNPKSINDILLPLSELSSKHKLDTDESQSLFEQCRDLVQKQLGIATEVQGGAASAEGQPQKRFMD